MNPVRSRALSQYARSIHPLFGLDVRNVVGERVGVYRAVVERDLSGGVIEPGQGVLHPILVVAVGEILARMSAATLGAVDCGIHGDNGLVNQIGEFERLDQIGIPYQRTIGYAQVAYAGIDLMAELGTFRKN